MYKSDTAYNELPLLPPQTELESKRILKKSIAANKALAELKGWSFNQSNPMLLFQSIALQEAKSSAEIENIVTTNDEIYKALATPTDKNISPATKEVLHYKEALWYGYRQIREDFPITVNMFVKLFQIVKQRSDGIRNLPGTVLKNSFNETVYTPPDNKSDIMRLMSNLENYINVDDENSDVDALIKLAVIHYQFESIHPFPDGNGRVGRIINVLYLIKKNLLDFPILYLSRYITKNKSAYYESIKNVTEKQAWDKWIWYMLDAIETTAKETLDCIKRIYREKERVLIFLSDKAPALSSKELVDLLFEQPYCKISFLVDRKISKTQTASRYLKQLCDLGILELIKRGRENYYVNVPLWNILIEDK